MRVVHVARHFHPHAGGTEQVIASLARELAADGVESSVIVTDRRRAGDGPAPEVPVLAVPVLGPDRFPVPRGRLTDVARTLREADVVHLHDVRFLFEATALVRRGPVVLTTHGLVFHTDAVAGLKRLAWRAWLAPRLRRLDSVVAVSGRDAELCRAGGVSDVVTIPNGVDVARYRGVADRPRGDVRALLYFGRVAPEKALETLAPVLAERREWQLTIAGDGDAAYRRRLADAFGPALARVTFVGPVDDARLASLLREADCVVVPSPRESFGLTLVEALASGVPVVAADAPAYREVSAGTATGLVRFEDGRDTADVVERTVAQWDPASAQARAGDFSWRSAAAAYRKLYDDVLEGV